MESFTNFLSLPAMTVLICLLMLLILSAFLRIALSFSIFFYGLGLNSPAGKFAAFALSLTFTFFVLQPELEEAFKIASFSSQNEASQNGLIRLADYWKSQISEKIPIETKTRFSSIASKKNPNQQIDPESWRILAPAFVVSELKNALFIGFKIILPFLMIDLLVAYIFTALEIRSISSLGLSFSLKLLAFLSVDGINLLINNFLASQ